MLELPEKFLEDMKTLLGDEFNQFIKEFDKKKTTGLRINTLKTSPKEFNDLNLFELSPVEWCEEGFYYDEEKYKMGKSPFHHAGVYYIQEPSAMSVAPMLGIEEGDKVLDLCAAPGGKSTYIGAKLNGTGILVANEIDSKRVKALGENIERLGIKNAVITNSNAKALSEKFPSYFDKIVVDAPCSGEGMFRKDSFAIEDWSYSKVLECSGIQREILEYAYDMLVNGGTIVYSTCTFQREENEDTISQFLDNHPDMELQIQKRLWPHKIKGEGHFAAKMIKKGDKHSKEDKISSNIIPKAQKNKNSKNNSLSKEQYQYFNEFVDKFLNISLGNNLSLHDENLYLLPSDMPDIKGLKVLRTGVNIGVFKKGRFEPAHGFAKMLKKDQVKNILELEGKEKEEEVYKYLNGNVINTGLDRGWVLVTFYGFPLGWGKETKGVLKNYYPKGLRII